MFCYKKTFKLNIMTSKSNAIRVTKFEVLLRNLFSQYLNSWLHTFLWIARTKVKEWRTNDHRRIKMENLKISIDKLLKLKRKLISLVSYTTVVIKKTNNFGDINNELSFSEGQRKANFEECDVKKRENAERLSQLKKEVKELRVEFARAKNVLNWRSDL